MKRLILILLFLLIMILFTIFIMTLGYKQRNYELLYLGFGLPLWLYLLITYLKWINRIEIGVDYLLIKNVILGQRKIDFKEIEEWQEIQTVRISQNNLLLKVKGKKILISNMIDLENYESLRHKLRTKFPELQSFKNSYNH